MNKITLAQLIRPAAPLRLGTGASLPILSMTMRNGLVDQADKFKKRIASTDLSPYKVVARGQLVVGFPIDEAVLAIQAQYEKAVVSPAYAIWEIQNSLVDAKYLEIFLRSPQAVSYYKARLQGSTARRRSLPNSVFLEMEVPLPSLPEQLRIVAVLDQAEKLRADRRTAISRHGELLDGIYSEIFSDRRADQKHFQNITVNDLLSRPLRNGISPSTRGEFDGEVLTLSAITRGSFDPTKSKWAKFENPHDSEKTVRAGELLICRGNGNLNLVGRGDMATASMPTVAFPDTMIAAQFDDRVVNLGYMRFAWNRPEVRRQIEAGARTTNGTFKISQHLLETIVLRVPPFQLQVEFQKHAEAVAAIVENHHRHLASLDDLFASLQHRAFEGTL